MLNAEGLPIPTRALRCTLNGFQLPAVCKRLAAWLHSRAPVAALRIPTLFSRLVLLGVLVGGGLSPASADYPFRLFIIQQQSFAVHFNGLVNDVGEWQHHKHSS